MINYVRKDVDNQGRLLHKIFEKQTNKVDRYLTTTITNQNHDPQYS